MGHSRPLFSLFSSFQYTVDSKQMFNINKFLPMTGFEPRTFGIGSNRSTNWATTTAKKSLKCAVVATQLVEQSLPTPEIRGSNPVIGNKISLSTA